MTETFPHQKARTRNFSLGAPRTFRIAGDGSRVWFLRSPAEDDPVNALWTYELSSGEERLVADPRALLYEDSSTTPRVEMSRRERTRELAGGIVAYSLDKAGMRATFELSGVVWVADAVSGECRPVEASHPAVEPRLDPTGTLVAFVSDNALRVAPVDGGEPRTVAGGQQDDAMWGLAEFVAAEEMHRTHGYWWAPDGTALLVARVDESEIERWWIADAAHPANEPRPVHYPRAGGNNANVTLHVVPIDGGRTVDVDWPREELPYVAVADWDSCGPFMAVQSRGQQTAVVMSIDPSTGATGELRRVTDEAWVDQVPGVPRRLADGRLVTVEPAPDKASLFVGGEVVTPASLEVTSVIGATEHTVVFTASAEPTELHVWRWSAPEGTLEQLSFEPGRHAAAVGGGRVLLGAQGLGHDGTRWTTDNHLFASHAAAPEFVPAVSFLTVGPHELRVGVVFPRDHVAGERLPVLMDPYGGPGRQRVIAAREAWREPQWLADQGFVVIVADGRGTPGRGRAWSRALYRDLGGPPLADQIAALEGVAAELPDVDLARVAIRGWSFGGYLAALAVLRRPDVFHAAVAGAPVTDWRLYDTHYTERYLGIDPEGVHGEAYAASSLEVTGANEPRPILLIHGLADDNVVAAHTLRFSHELLEAGWPHSVLPLAGVTHMTPQPAIAENLLRTQVAFLSEALGIPPRAPER
jgi:dipeptidyl-peptidase-4